MQHLVHRGNGKGLHRQLDPRTGTVTEYTMPTPRPMTHTPLFSIPTAFVWFTVQVGKHGRQARPSDRKNQFEKMGTADARPYGIVVNSKHSVFLRIRHNKLVR